MGITQYSEVSAEYASLLVENYTNALRSVRKYDLEFFQPLAAPPNNHKSPKQPQRVQKRRSRDAEDHKDSNAPTTSSNEGDRAKLWTNARIVRGDAEAAEMHQTRRWRSSRTARDHGDYRAQKTSSNGGGRAELRRNAAGTRKKHTQIFTQSTARPTTHPSPG